MTHKRKFTVLGGGPAGLAVGFYGQSAGFTFRIDEAQNRVGGNCITLQHGEFRFDSGAHRFHHKDPQVTAEIRQLLGPDLRKIKTLGPVNITKATVSLLRGRLGKPSAHRSFRDFAVHSYGADIASRFLLNYSEKLCARRPWEASETESPSGELAALA